jgi:hypothetical protein
MTVIIHEARSRIGYQKLFLLCLLVRCYMQNGGQTHEHSKAVAYPVCLWHGFNTCKGLHFMSGKTSVAGNKFQSHTNHQSIS